MKTSQAFLIVLFAFQGLALPQSSRHQQSLTEKEYPYCNSPDDPSIPCDEKYDNGTYIDGNRPDPNAACSNIFFMCTNGRSTCFNCQIINELRLYYDHPRLDCDYRENVAGCTGVSDSTAASLSTSTSQATPSPTPVTTESTVPTIPPGYVCTDDNGFFPIDPNKCQPNYYVCVNGAPSIGMCPPGAVFDPATLYCVPEEQASCSSPLTTTTTATSTISTTELTATRTTTPTTPRPTVPIDYVCPDPNGFFPIDPSQCLPNYYICVNGAPNIGTCPPGSIFDPATLYCEFEEQASCNYQCPASSGFFPVYGHETDQCFNGYVTCLGGIAYPTRCPPSSVFDPENGFCVPASSNSCPEEITTTPGTPTTLTPVDPSNPCCPGVGEFPLQGSCTQYVVCASDYVPVIASCRVGQVFNPYLGICDDPANVPGCNFYSITDYIQGLKNVGIKSSRDKC